MPGLLIVVVLASAVLYAVLICYRLFFHPLAKYPGSKLAACSLWYEFYYDVVLRGQLIWQIQKWHEEYGPVIRINPNELHVLDSNYLDEIFGSQTRIRDKYAPWVASTGTPGASFATVSHDHHRLRRSALNPFFSKKAVVSLESLIRTKISVLADRFEQACQTGEVIRVDAAFTALTMDIICQYIFATDDDYLSKHDFQLAWKECLDTAFEAAALLRQFPWMGSMMKAVPVWLMAKFNPPMAMLTSMHVDVTKRAKAVLDGDDSQSDNKTSSQMERKTIFHELRDGNLPPEEKDLERLCDETHILTGAGSETTAQTLAYITYYLLKNPEKLQRLRQEVRPVLARAGDSVSHIELEQLPYTSAIVAEGLRLSYGITTRLPRVAPTETLKYDEWTIPPGTPISATPYFTLVDPTIFTEPDKFSPERWLSSSDASLPASRSLLYRYLVNFGKGTRQCIGINLAYAEIYLATAIIFTKFDMQLYETTIDDLLCKHDFFTATARLDSKGIRVKVVGVAT